MLVYIVYYNGTIYNSDNTIKIKENKLAKMKSRNQPRHSRHVHHCGTDYKKID